MATRHEEIADTLRDAINNGTWPVGTPLPPETELALTFGASRGTVRHALAGLAADGLISSRQGARRIVLGSHRSQSFTELRSFAQWAAATGRTRTRPVI